MTPCPRCATPLDRLPARCPVCAAPARTADPDARRAVAAYLVGTSAAAAPAALDDPDFAAHLRAELGLDLDDGPCAAFRAQAAAFAELPPAARDVEAPDLAEHVQECGACRRLLWELRPLWDATGTLAEPLCVTVGSSRVRDRGVGPPATPVAFAALRAGPDDANPVPLEWALVVPDAGTLRVRVAAGPRVAVWSDDAEGTVEFLTVGGATIFSAAFADLPPDGVPLPPGEWVVAGTLGAAAWRFTLDLAADGA